MRVKPLILAIDDDEFFRKTIEVVLLSLGMTPKVVASVNEFYDAAITLDPDLLLVDLQIGEVSGLEVIEGLKEKGIEKPVVVVSGVRDSATTAHALELGAEDYILKPFDKILFANKLAQFVNTPEIEDQAKLLRNLDGKGVEARVIFDGTISGIDELGIFFAAPHLIPKGAVVRLAGDFIGELGSKAEECLVCVTQTQLNSKTGLYEMYAEFEGVNVDFLQGVRKWISAKNAKSAA